MFEKACSSIKKFPTEFLQAKYELRDGIAQMSKLSYRRYDN